MSYVLGSRASIGGVLGAGRGGAAAQWWLSGGVSAANAIAVYQPIGAASLAASYTNLANPGTYDAAPGVAPTFDTATGWTFNGSQYLTTGVVPGSGWSAIGRFSDATGNDGTILGAYTSAGNLFIMKCRNNSATNRLWRYGNSEKSAIPAAAAGVMAMAGPTGYFDGAEVVTTIGTWGGTPTRDINIAVSNQGSLVAYLTGKIQAIAIYNMTLSAVQAAAISAAMAAL